MQNTVQSIARVSLFFMLTLGLVHIMSNVLIVDGVRGKTLTILFQTLDLPFLAAALVYFTSQVSLKLEESLGNLRIPLIALSGMSVLIFIFVLYLNFALPDASF